jgi:hypothetical protein
MNSTMNALAPQIGFDRFIQLDWAAAALKVRAGTASLDDLNELLDAAALGAEARAKTRTKLNAIWLEPRVELIGFANRGIEIFKTNTDAPILALSWGMAIASYPFFGKVAELAGRLTALHGDCTSLEIHRRVSEIYGEREVTKRATQAVIQTQSNWECIERIENGKRLVRRESLTISNNKLAAWIIEGAIRYIDKPVSVPLLRSMPVLYPFSLSQALSYVVSHSENLELRSDGPSNQFVALRARG